MKINRVGVDIGKQYFHVCGVSQNGQVMWREALRRSKWLKALKEHVPAGTAIGLEACGSAHHWARELRALGFEPKLIAPQFVKPYVQSNKTDHADAEAIAEAMSRPKMRFVAVKNISQQELQAIHRIRDELIKQRTAKANQTRGLLAELGHVAAPTLARLKQALSTWSDNEASTFSERFRELLCGLRDDLSYLDERIKKLDQQMNQAAKTDTVARRLMQLRGVGPVNATALSVALGDGRSFRNGRDFAVSLGLTPRQHSTGGRPTLLGISKRGDAYLRKQLVHGARAVVTYATRRDDELSRWITRLAQRKHPNVVTVAVAAKTARMAWAMTRYEIDYDEAFAT